MVNILVFARIAFKDVLNFTFQLTDAILQEGVEKELKVPCLILFGNRMDHLDIGMNNEID